MSIDSSGCGPRRRAIPDGDDRERLICPDCGYVRYDNPRIVVGVVATWQTRYLLVKRAIAPRIGYWTLPAGFMELGETGRDGARREAREEANAQLEIDALLGVYDLDHIGQVHLIYRARLTAATVAHGPECRDARLFSWDDIPWNRLAFPSVHWALKDHRRHRGRTDFAPATTPAGGPRAPETPAAPQRPA